MTQFTGGLPFRLDQILGSRPSLISTWLAPKPRSTNVSVSVPETLAAHKSSISATSFFLPPFFCLLRRHEQGQSRLILDFGVERAQPFSLGGT